VTGAPVPSSVAVSNRMGRQRTRHTGPEVALRRELHRRGLRYRLHRQPLPGLRRTPDLVFARARLVVDVRGCFWHGCQRCKTVPKANAEWWTGKIAANRRRDLETEQALRAAGWTVVVVWEHDSIDAAADRVASALQSS